ncbi:MAG: hypothetical protein U0264_01595 [Candidatus Kapaibacterium sp.]
MNDTTPKLYASSKALHWSAIRDLRVASDIAGAGASGEFSPDGITAEQIYGASIGVPGAGAHSGYGMFTDLNGNTICIATESRPAWGMIKGKDLLGRDPYIFRIPRNMGSGGAFESNAFMIGGVGKSFGEHAGWSEAESSQVTGLPGITLNLYNDFPHLLEQIENTGRKFDRPIVILSSGEPITIGSVLEKALTFILAVAKPFAGMIGIPPELFDVLAQSLQVIATQGKFSIDILAGAAQLIIPAEYRSLIQPAKSIYGNIESGNYLSAMQELGVHVNFQGATKSLLGGDISSLFEKSSLPYTDLVGKVQTMFQFDTIRSLSAATRSGSVLNNLIDAGTMTKVPVLQNLLATTTADTLTSAIPGVLDIMQAAVNQTNDISHPDLYKGAIQLGLGQIVGADTFDELTLRGLKEKANQILENGGKRYAIPITIPQTKRHEWAQSVADEVGIEVLADIAGGGVQQQSAIPQTLSRAWG